MCIRDRSSGSGDALRVNVLVKPIRSGLTTNLVITTSRRTYLLELPSTEQAWMASVSWDYPKDRMLALQRQAQAASAAAPVDTGLSLEKIRFRYAVSGINPPWKPLRAFDDGEKFYIQFPQGIAQGELPPLFEMCIRDRAGTAQALALLVQARPPPAKRQKVPPARPSRSNPPGPSGCTAASRSPMPRPPPPTRCAVATVAVRAKARACAIPIADFQGEPHAIQTTAGALCRYAAACHPVPIRRAGVGLSLIHI